MHGGRADSADDAAGRDESGPIEADRDGLAFDVESLWALFEGAEGGAETHDPLIGTSIGGVTLLRMVGEGGMGRVYEAAQDQPRRSVAIKVQRPGRLDRESTRRFLRELEVLGRLSHPALCRVFAAGSHLTGGSRLPWFTMEFVADALPITRYAQVHALPLRRRVELFRDVCEGVAAAHEAGIVHRDLKAANILVGADGMPKVIDFGVAAAIRGNAHATSLTDTGRIVGTLAALAPELLDSRRAEECPRSDVWALGVILHELVTGEVPFPADHSSVVEVIEKIRSRRPSLAARCPARLGRHLGGLVDRALAIDPESRFADARDLARALSETLERFPATDDGWSSHPHLDLRAVPSWRWGWIAAAGVVVAALAASAPMLARQGGVGGEEAGRTTGERPDPSPPFDPPAFATSPITNPDFAHAVRDVFSPDADRHLVESAAMRKWREPFNRNATYWGPEAPDVPATLVYRFDFPRPSRRIHVKAVFRAWDGEREPGVIGKGACALEYSTDGAQWRPVINGIEPRLYGVGLLIDDLLPDDACGTSTLWLRVRLLVSDGWANGSYSVAQFLRHDAAAAATANATAFEIDVECVPPGDVAGDAGS